MEQEHTKQIQVNHLVMMPMRVTIRLEHTKEFQRLFKIHVQQENTKLILLNPLVMMQIQVTIHLEQLVD